jgi:L,D-peptidoglycan transpeptidase YkuD (ErfK/YbiS/YcfS/YnhG family)
MAKTETAAVKKQLFVLVRPAPSDKSRALLQIGSLTFPAAIGRTGRSAFKKEGDGRTPISTMRLLYGYHRADRMSALKTALPMIRTRKDMLWCDAPDHAAYNCPVQAPFKASHEEMMRQDSLYDVCLVLDWNITSRSRNRGSAIFMHLIRPGYQPTAGCIALSPANMRRILPLLKRGTRVRVI